LREREREREREIDGDCEMKRYSNDDDEFNDEEIREMNMVRLFSFPNNYRPLFNLILKN
jgi:hypothetical protein